MRPNRKDAWKVVVFIALTGCSDFSQHRFGGVRTNPDDAAPGSPPTEPALAIPSSPSVAHADVNRSDQGAKQANSVPGSEPNVQRADLKLTPQLASNPLRTLYDRARLPYADMDSYIFRMKRREVVGGRKQPEEIVTVKVRREPYSVYLKWLNPECKGRETLYVRGKYDNKMQVLLGPGDPFSFLMARTSIAPDDPMARSKSRYPITETGFGPLIERYGKMVAAAEKGDAKEGTVKYLGLVARLEFAAKVEGVYQTLPANCDPQLPKGGERWWFFDAASGLPALVIAHDLSGEVEYYCYDRVEFVRLDDDDFNPERLWRK